MSALIPEMLLQITYPDTEYEKRRTSPHCSGNLFLDFFAGARFLTAPYSADLFSTAYLHCAPSWRSSHQAVFRKYLTFELSAAARPKTLPLNWL